MNEPEVSLSPPQPKRRRRYTREEKAQWVQRYSESKLIQREFCQLHGLSSSCLQRWLSESSALGAASPVIGPSAPLEPLFKELSFPLPSVGSPLWVAEVSRPSGTVVRLGAAIDAKLLAELLRLC